MSSWSDMDVAEYDAWLDEHDLTFQMNYQHVDSYIGGNSVTQLLLKIVVDYFL